MTDERIEPIILRSLATNDEFCRKVTPYLKEEYFDNPAERIIYKKLNDLFIQYNVMPAKEALLVGLGGDKTVPEQLFPVCKEIVKGLDPISLDAKWLLDTTEKFVKDKSVYNAVLTAIEILDGKHKKFQPDAIPLLMQEALAVGFDNDVGHDYFAEAGKRWEFMHDVAQRIPFKLKSLNDITKGGVPRKTLNVFMAGTNVGKSMIMCDWAAWLVTQGYNVLYVTAEMADMRIGERLDANLLDISLDDIEGLAKEAFLSRLAKMQGKTKGRLIIKEYPTSTAHAGHIHALLGELKMKQNFVPDIIFIDYLNIFTSQRFKDNSNSYGYIKAIAEEFRGLAVVHNVPIISATQVNRGGYSNTDMDVDDTSESWGLPSTVDWFMAVIETEELAKLCQLMMKQLKSRYGDKMKNRRFIVGVDKGKQKLYDVEQKAQTVGMGVIKDSEAKDSVASVAADFFKKPGHKAGVTDSRKKIGPTFT